MCEFITIGLHFVSGSISLYLLLETWNSLVWPLDGISVALTEYKHHFFKAWQVFFFFLFLFFSPPLNFSHSRILKSQAVSTRTNTVSHQPNCWNVRSRSLDAQVVALQCLWLVPVNILAVAGFHSALWQEKKQTWPLGAVLQYTGWYWVSWVL